MKQTKTQNNKKLQRHYGGKPENPTSHFSHLTSDPKGITLIALVITIIVMIILVVVAIRITAQGKLFNYAGNAVKETETAKGNENEILNGKIQVGDKMYGSIEDYLAGNPMGTWVDNEDGTFTDTVAKITVKVGDFVKYDSPTTYEDDGTKGWRVLGVENGQLLIMADTKVGSITLSGSAGDFTGGVAKLDEMCQEYKDETYATSARSIRVEDINKITGYNPLCTGVKNPSKEQIDKGDKIYGKGNVNQYGNKVKYTLREETPAGEDGTAATYRVWYQYGDKDPIKGSSTSYNKFTHLDGTKLVTEEQYNAAEDKTGISKEIEVESDDYYYYPNSLGTSSTISDSNPGISGTSAAYDMIFNKYDGTKDSYWLASPCVNADSGLVVWRVRYVNSGGNVYYSSLWYSGHGSISTTSHGVRPVVSLSSKVQLGVGTEVEGKEGVMSYSVSLGT